MVADSQSSSQIGDVSRFTDMMLLTPTEREARLAVHDFESGLVILAEKLRTKSRAKNVILTLGAEGLLSHASSERKDERVDRPASCFKLEHPEILRVLEIVCL